MPLFARDELVDWGFAPGGFWLTVGERNVATLFVDENGAATHAWPGPAGASICAVSGNRCSYFAPSGVSELAFGIVNIDSGVRIDGPILESAQAAATSTHICLRRRNTVEAYDWDLKLLWKSSRIDSVRTMRSSDVFIAGDIVVINFGVRKTARDPCTIRGLNIRTGANVWSYTTKAYATLTVEDGCVGLASAGRMVVLDAKTGAVTFDAPSGFEKPAAGDTLWFRCGRLVYTSCAHGAMRIFDAASGSLVTELRLTPPYGFPEDSPPTAFREGFVAWVDPSNVALRGIVSGLLVVPSFEVESGEVLAEPRTPYSARTLSGADGESYRIEMQPDELDRVLRFGAIALKETAITYGSHVWEGDSRNKRFNGHLELALDFSRYDERERRAIEDMVAESETELRKLGVFAGNGKGGVTLRLMAPT